MTGGNAGGSSAMVTSPGLAFCTRRNEFASIAADVRCGLNPGLIATVDWRVALDVEAVLHLKASRGWIRMTDELRGVPWFPGGVAHHLLQESRGLPGLDGELIHTVRLLGDERL